PDGVFVGVVQDLCRGLAFQPVPVFVLFSGHLLIEGRIQIVGIHVIAPPHAVSVSFRGCGAAPDASSCPAPRAVRSWRSRTPAESGPCRPDSEACPAPPDGRTLPADHPHKRKACPLPPWRRPAAGTDCPAGPWSPPGAGAFERAHCQCGSGCRVGLCRGLPGGSSGLSTGAYIPVSKRKTPRT